jgi:hypothetical protein
MKSHNGHRSWNAWNVNLWINNDESLYGWAVSMVNKHGKDKAARLMARNLYGEKTPDGGKYNKTSIRLALKGI